MKVACFVNPLVQARGPCFNFGWVETLANLLQPLRRDARCECMLIAGGWFKDWASQNQKGALLTGLRTVWIDELALYRRLRALGELPTALDQTAYQADDAEHPALRVIAEAMARDVNGFEPDIIIGFAGQANYLARLWPSALRLHIERGHFGRDPYPFSMYFDHVGTHARSAVATRRRAEAGISLDVGWAHAGVGIPLADGSRLRRPGSIPDPGLAQAIRSTVPASAAGLERVFLRRAGQLPHAIRIPVRRPGCGPERCRGDRDRAPQWRSRSETIRLLREHRHASQDVSEYRLSRRIPAVPVAVATPGAAGRRRLERLVERSVTRRCCSAVCSALRPPRNCRNVADATTLEDFFARLGHRRSTNVDADNFLAWLLERYLVPASLLTDGRWFHDYLQRRLDAARRVSDPIDAFVPTADADRLMDAWIVKTPPLAMASPQGEDDPSVAELITNLKAVRCERDALLKSTSWRITAPLRLVKQAAGRARFRH